MTGAGGLETGDGGDTDGTGLLERRPVRSDRRVAGYVSGRRGGGYPAERRVPAPRGVRVGRLGMAGPGPARGRDLDTPDRCARLPRAVRTDGARGARAVSEHERGRAGLRQPLLGGVGSVRGHRAGPGPGTGWRPHRSSCGYHSPRPPPSRRAGGHRRGDRAPPLSLGTMGARLFLDTGPTIRRERPPGVDTVQPGGGIEPVR